MRRAVTTALLLGLSAPGFALAQGASSSPLTESHARSAMADFGCNNISSIGPGPQGSYHSQCTKGGKVINVMMDRTGKVSEATNVTHVNEGQARYALTSFGCNNISNLGTGPGGTWHGQCSKGGTATDVMVDAKGVASAAKAPHVTEAAARSMLTDFGCNNISTLTMGENGNWYGQCAKGGKTQNVSVDKQGKMAAN